ncbi:MAG: patatin-like phospholipase family protein [Rhodoferax sp.]|nr:patatin-like phospholipase family protein [Rhodoferax sp.]
MERIRIFRGIAAATLCALLVAGWAHASAPGIALVLSGGGARGLAHIGVLRELERMRIPVACLVGTSMGGVVGGVYASGMPIDQLERAARAIDWTQAFQDTPDRSAMLARRKKDENGHFARPEFGYNAGSVASPAGVIYGQNLSEIFSRFSQRAADIDHFDRLPIPYRAVATDIVTGQAVVLDKGSLALAMRATMSVPAVMAPLELEGRLLIDGGLVDNLPIARARALCGEVVIAVNLGTPLLERKDIGSAVSVGLQMVNILTEQNVRASLASLTPQDVLISPQLDGLNSGSFDRIDALIAAGEQATRAVAAQLQPLSVSAQAFALWKQRHDQKEVLDLQPDEVRITPLKWVNPDILRSALLPENVDVPTEAQLMEGVAKIYGRGDFERVQLNFTQDKGRRIALVEPTEKSWGPNYLRFGLSMVAQSGESTSFNAVAGYTRSWINSYGARWQNIVQIGEKNALHAEFHQPLAPGSSLFVAPRLLATQDQSPIYLGSAQVARFSRTQALTALELGAELGHSGEMRLGLQIGREGYQADVGLVAGSTDTTPIRALTARLDVDALDKANFPTQGYRVLLDLHDASKSLGNQNEFRRQVLDITLARTWNQNTFSAQFIGGKVDYAGAAGNIVFDLIPLGGFQRLSGYPAGRFRVDQLAFARLGYQRNIPPLLGLNLGGIISQTYLGGTLEFAHLEQSYDPRTPSGAYQSGSVFIGTDTVLGPAALSFGLSQQGTGTVWLSIGVPWTLR